ncbi:MAG: succinate dehydrogenase, hydrophobic membrane anchor protein [Paracoccaceae bacterium]
MQYLTARKRAEGLGSAKSGTEHFWRMHLTSVALAVLVPVFVFTFGCILGAPHAEVAAYFARPFPAIVTALTLVVGFLHFAAGARVMIEDYWQGAARHWLIIGVSGLSYACIATGLFALVRLAL